MSVCSTPAATQWSNAARRTSSPKSLPNSVGKVGPITIRWNRRSGCSSRHERIALSRALLDEAYAPSPHLGAPAESEETKEMSPSGESTGSAARQTSIAPTTFTS